MNFVILCSWLIFFSLLLELHISNPCMHYYGGHQTLMRLPSNSLQAAFLQALLDRRRRMANIK